MNVGIIFQFIMGLLIITFIVYKVIYDKDYFKRLRKFHGFEEKNKITLKQYKDHNEIEFDDAEQVKNFKRLK